MSLYVFDHPLIQHKLSILRNEVTCTKEFRELSAIIKAYPNLTVAMRLMT